MTGRPSGKTDPPATPDPSPTPIAGREEEEAKKKARRRGGRSGRESTILAGKFNQQSGGNNILNTSLGGQG
jgi:hypothetical protein